jgi:soluble lytic murein transglycosylase-like protein
MAFITVPQTQVPQLIANAAAKYGVPSTLAMEVAAQESNYNQKAVSPAGAIGVMQLEPATAAQYNANPYDTTQNIDAGVHYLADLLNQFGGDQSKALAAYNAGPGATSSALSAAAASGSSDWLSLLPSETQSYVAAILGNAGTAYSVSAPGGANSFSSGVSGSSPFSSTGPSAQTILYVVLAGIGALFLADVLFG